MMSDSTTTPLTLADPRRAPDGARPCAHCDAGATMWLRTTADCGLVVAALSCDEHEGVVRSRLSDVTPADVAARVPRSRRAARAAACRRRAERLRVRAGGYGRESARLAGASSLTHTTALLGGYTARLADAQDALAEALEAST